MVNEHLVGLLTRIHLEPSVGDAQRVDGYRVARGQCNYKGAAAKSFAVGLISDTYRPAQLDVI